MFPEPVEAGPEPVEGGSARFSPVGVNSIAAGWSPCLGYEDLIPERRERIMRRNNEGRQAR